MHQETGLRKKDNTNTSNKTAVIRISKNITYLIRLNGFSKNFNEKVGNVYNNFLSSEIPDNCCVLEVHPAEIREDDDRISAKRNTKNWEIKGRGMEISISGKDVFSKIYPDIHIFDSLLRVLTSYFSVDNNSILIHAAAMKKKLFIGPSGSGKTTSVRGREGFIGDDIIMLSKEKSVWKSVAVPFSGEFMGRIKKTESEISDIYVLDIEKDEKLTQSVLYRSLLKNLIYFVPDTEKFEQVLDMCADISLKVKGHGFKNK